MSLQKIEFVRTARRRATFLRPEPPDEDNFLAQASNEKGVPMSADRSRAHALTIGVLTIASAPTNAR